MTGAVWCFTGIDDSIPSRSRDHDRRHHGVRGSDVLNIIQTSMQLIINNEMQKRTIGQFRRVILRDVDLEEIFFSTSPYYC